MVLREEGITMALSKKQLRKRRINEARLWVRVDVKNNVISTQTKKSEAWLCRPANVAARLETNAEVIKRLPSLARF